MVEEIHSPLRDYRDTYSDRFAEAAERAFQEFADTAGVDVEANRLTCRKLAATQDARRKAASQLAWWWVLCIVLWVTAAASFVVWYLGYIELPIPIAGTAAVAALEFAFIHRKIRALGRRKRELQDREAQLLSEAWGQMEPLNRLYDDEILHRLTHQVIPIVSLDTCLRSSQMQRFSDDFGFNDPGEHRRDRAAVNVQSGNINGNPFMICRRLVHTMGHKTYTGSITVMVSKTRTVNGRTQRYMAPEVLTATVTKPFPEYSHTTELIYGNQAAPELTFTRRKNRFSNREGSLSYKLTEWRLKRKAAKMSQDFALMTNEEFEVLFTTDDRNSNQQYALLFTPVAQANMIDLIRDNDSTGYGDDFDFYKQGRINTVISEHMQGCDLSWSPERLRTFDYDKAHDLFVGTLVNDFKGLYFALAPLLCIPLYQQMHPDYDVRMHRPLDDTFHPLQQEVLAYYWGVDRFKHPDCVTECILKTQSRRLEDGASLVDVTSYGYRSVPRVDYVTRSDSNGRLHRVPVRWDEYLPVEARGSFCMADTAASQPQEQEQKATTPRERFEAASRCLRARPDAVLFRNIATWMASGR